MDSAGSVYDGLCEQVEWFFQRWTPELPDGWVPVPLDDVIQFHAVLPVSEFAVYAPDPQISLYHNRLRGFRVTPDGTGWMVGRPGTMCSESSGTTFFPTPQAAIAYWELTYDGR